MEVKVDRYTNIKGMQLDNSIASFNSESQQRGQYVFENLNIRLTPNKDNTACSMANDLAPMPLTVLLGNALGTCVANEKLVVFTHEGTTDRIYVLTPSDSDIFTNLLYLGNLHLSLTIKTKFFYENEALQKVYWCDGVNQNRVINIAADEFERGKWLARANPFDFVPELHLEELVTIERNIDASGRFDAGVLQYYLTYVNYYGLESNIFYTSPLLYTSHSDRGGMYASNGDGTSNNICANSFTIKISNVQSEYDYIRVYSTLRTSLDGEPLAKLVTEIKISENISREAITVQVPGYYYIDRATEQTASSLVGFLDMSLLTFYKPIADSTNQYEKCVLSEVLSLLANDYKVSAGEAASLGVKDVFLSGTNDLGTLLIGAYYKIPCPFTDIPGLLILKASIYDTTTTKDPFGYERIFDTNDSKLDGKYIYIGLEKSKANPTSASNITPKYFILAAEDESDKHSSGYLKLVEYTYYVKDSLTNDSRSAINFGYTLPTSYTEYTDQILPIQYIDTGTLGSTIVPTDLFFLGGTPCSASTLEQKDNTLFLGDINTINFAPALAPELEIYLLKFLTAGTNSLEFTQSKQLALPDLQEYPYDCLLKYNSYLYKLFKRGETYRLGIQFLDKYGKWSLTIHLKDILTPSTISTIVPNSSLEGCKVSWKVPTLTIDPALTITVGSTTLTFYALIEQLYASGFRKIRPVIVYPEFLDRCCITLGLVCPTVFNTEDRIDNSPYVLASWFFRPNAGFPINRLVSTSTNSLLGFTGTLILVQTEGPTVNPATLALQKGYTLSVTATSSYTGLTDLSLLSFTVDSFSTKATEKKGTNQTTYSYNSITVHINGTLNPTTLAAFTSDVFNMYSDKIVVTVACHGTPLGTYEISFNRSTAVRVEEGLELTETINKRDNTKYVTAGSFIENRHLHSISGTLGRLGVDADGKICAEQNLTSNYKAAEIQCIDVAPSTYDLVDKSFTGSGTLFPSDIFANAFFVDSSIVTLNSPDLISDLAYTSINTEGLLFRIVGYAPLQYTTSNIDILTETPATTLYYKGKGVNFSENPPGFLKKSTYNGFSNFGGRLFTNAALWWDEISYRNNGGASAYRRGSLGGGRGSIKDTGFVVYPWHKSNSLSNSKNRTSFSATADDNTLYQALWPTMTGKLKLKILANTRISLFTEFLEDSKIWTPTSTIDVTKFTSSEPTIAKVNSDGNELNYQGNINKIVIQNDSWDTQSGRGSIAYDNLDVLLKDGYPLMVLSKEAKASQFGDPSKYVSLYARLLSYQSITDLDITKADTWNAYNAEMLNSGSTDVTSFADRSIYDVQGNDGVLMKYKSTPHFVVNLSADKDELCLPTMYYSSGGSSIYEEGDSGQVFTIPKITGDLENRILPHTRLGSTASHPRIERGSAYPYAYLWVGELYRTVSNLYGGTSAGALEANIWLPCGDGVPLTHWLGQKATTTGQYTYQLLWEEGDTYYQRYDCMKTYPYTMEDLNQIYETVSFMVESHVNLDGRYDLNRGNSNNLAIVPGVNFNLFNPVYSLKNNFFTYQYNNTEKVAASSYPNQIIWSETKINGELVDTWTTLTLNSFLDLDGDKGKITSLNKLNNQLFAILDHGVCMIKYNENVLISTESGIPVLLANSGKVDGKQYISEKIGCQDSLKVLLSDKGVYFIDDNHHSLYGLDGLNLVDLSTVKGLSTTFRNATTTKLLLDAYMHDIHIAGNFKSGDPFLNRASLDKSALYRSTLAFNENLSEYTSFFTYNFDFMDTVAGNTYSIHNTGGRRVTHQTPVMNCTVSLMHRGEYTSNYYSIFVVNPSPVDKVFNNIEFNGSVTDTENNITSSCPFEELSTWNEYQYGTSVLTTRGTRLDKSSVSIPSSLKLKFRVWRANIPRHNTDYAGNIAKLRSRMRSPWIYLKLSNSSYLGKMQFHDLNVLYYE